MARTVILLTQPWSELPLEQLAQKAGEWGYQGLELACAGDHFEVQRAQGEDEYCQARLDLLARHDLGCPVLSTHRLGQAVGDIVAARHQAVVPDYVWGDGDVDSVPERAAEEMMSAIRAAQKLGAEVASGWTGSPVWPLQCSAVPASVEDLRAGFEEFARRWTPILDACRDAGVRYAALVQPGQIAFDLTSAELALEALGGREEFGFALDPGQLHWQGLDPVVLVRRFP
ncbi:MAG: sugar phosphate isomerase/epimerase family protein, partial [Gemmataceae bacterium]